MHNERPLLQQLQKFIEQEPSSFHVPGHKYGQLSGLPTALKSALQYDMTELNGLDDLHQPEAVIQEAQKLLSHTYQSDESFFLVNGSTVGNLAMIYATCQPGDYIIVQRNAHKSIFNAIELVGARPVYVAAIWDDDTQTATNVTRETIREALEKHPHSKAVVLTYPNYYGVANGDIKEVIEYCHTVGIPVLVDEAHGAHFKVGESFPASALDFGADVVVHSAHKTLPAMTMASFLHVKSSLVSPKRIQKYLQMLQSSSPSYLLLVSLDDARHYVDTYSLKDEVAFQQFRSQLIESLSNIKNIDLIEVDDPLKLLLRMPGYSGYQILSCLEEVGIYAELADMHQVLLILPLIKEEHSVAIKEIVCKIQDAFETLQKQEKIILPKRMPLYVNEVTQICYNQEELHQASKQFTSFEQSVGKICAGMIIPYPPGIPILMAGEKITEETIQSIESLANMNAKFQGSIRIDEQKILVINE